MIITIFNQKGGCGKTTTVLTLGSILAEMNKRVLILDLDPQSNTTAGVGIKNVTDKNTYDLLKSSKLMHDEVTSFITKTDFQNLYCIPSDVSLSNAEITLSNVICRESILKKIIKHIDRDFDFILIDTPPSLGLLSINSLTAADYLIIPTNANYFCVKGIEDVISTYQLVKTNLNNNLDIGVLITMFNGNINLSKSIKANLHEAFGDKLFDTIIRQDCKIQYSQDAQKPLAYYNKKCNGYKDYYDFTMEVLNYGK